MSWINGNGFIPNDGLNGSASPWAVPNESTGPFPTGSPGYFGYGPANADAFRPAWFGGSTLPGGVPNPLASDGMGGILAQLAAQVQQSISQLSNTLFGTASSKNSNASGSATFQSVALASVGDPHLSVNGTEQNADGSTVNVSSHFDSMTAQQDLFSTHDFGDGFRVSTTVTQPASNGVTQNATATASMDGGRENVTMTDTGAISVTDHGQAIALTPGQTVTLTGGQQVSESANGAVSIAESAFGENLTTTFTQNGSGGVDVTATGQNVTLSGALVTGGTTPVTQAPNNVRKTYARV